MERAASTNDSEALWRYGYYLYYGIGCARNPKEAAEYYKRSAKLGSKEGKKWLDSLNTK